MKSFQVMKHQYRCDICGCYLDPGEGRICDECQDKQRRKERMSARYHGMMAMDADGQYEIGMEDMYGTEFI